ncbi:hypothetical protein DSO57_1033372 [Entomophthora muscae]|uniref:Uncharacterized protein n=1 Tax=Entomophthora muscae TaxID=34485 RepID=A0ACC2SPW6_9FUNG|nr:hypothetical protein DSO57_1033372 [Entomophthora muscae]
MIKLDASMASSNAGLILSIRQSRGFTLLSTGDWTCQQAKLTHPCSYTRTESGSANHGGIKEVLTDKES